MFWARATGTGAFLGLLGGTATSALFHSLTTAMGNSLGIKGGYLWILLGRTSDTVPGLVAFRSDMAQNFWLASFAFTACLLLTIVISLATARTKTNEELKGLVYSLTPKLKDEEQNWLLRPAVFGTILIIGCVILNIIFW
jgi:SSS family solute:Na+ symporter